MWVHLQNFLHYISKEIMYKPNHKYFHIDYKRWYFTSEKNFIYCLVQADFNSNSISFHNFIITPLIHISLHQSFYLQFQLQPYHLQFLPRDAMLARY